jgi:hypothetical protein
MNNDDIHQLFIDTWHRELSADDAHEELPYYEADVDEKIREILIDVYNRQQSADDGFEEYLDLTEGLGFIL